MAWFEIAGLAISGLGFLRDLWKDHKDAGAWDEQELDVDREFLATALEQGRLTGNKSEYSWARKNRVPTLELKGTHAVVLAFNEARKIRYRLVQGPPANRLILMKKISRP